MAHVAAAECKVGVSSFLPPLVPAPSSSYLMWQGAARIGPASPSLVVSSMNGTPFFMACMYADQAQVDTLSMGGMSSMDAASTARRSASSSVAACAARSSA